MKVDFGLRDTERGWMERIDRVVVAFTQEWFNWLAWILILGALQYIHAKTKSGVIAVIIVFSWPLFWRYLIAKFDSLELTGLPWIKSRKVSVTISTLIMCSLAWLFWWVAKIAVKLMESTGV